MQFDSENKNSKWYDATKLEMESMLEYKQLYARPKHQIRQHFDDPYLDFYSINCTQIWLILLKIMSAIINVTWAQCDS